MGCTVVFAAVILGIESKYFFHDSFLDGLMHPFQVIILLSVIEFPIFLLKDKHPKAAETYKKWLTRISIVLAGGIILLLIVLYLNSRFHFWF